MARVETAFYAVVEKKGNHHILSAFLLKYLAMASPNIHQHPSLLLNCSYWSFLFGRQQNCGGPSRAGPCWHTLSKAFVRAGLRPRSREPKAWEEIPCPKIRSEAPRTTFSPECFNTEEVDRIKKNPRELLRRTTHLLGVHSCQWPF